MEDLIYKYLDRILDRVDITDTCWNWNSTIGTNGYGVIRMGKKMYSSHRVMFLLLKDELKPGLVLDHICNNRKCCNPEHLEQVTLVENIKRGDHKPKVPRTHCAHGHMMTFDNTIIYIPSKYPNKILKECRKCANKSNRESARRKRMLNINKSVKL